MSTVCPNTSSQEWKDLVKGLGSEGLAHVAFDMNNNDIPTVDEAKQLLMNRTVPDLDEEAARRSDEQKLKNAKTEHARMKSMHTSTGSIKQKETLLKLMEMNMEHQKFLEERISNRENNIPPERSISVSNFIGKSEFKGDPSKTQAFSRFGSFIHGVVENAYLASLKQGIPIKSVLDIPEFFQQEYDNYMNEYPFFIDNLTPAIMKLFVKELIDHVAVNLNKGYIILPESTIMGDMNDGTKIVGRTDITMIDNNGKIHIIDFKTKKVSDFLETDPFGVQRCNMDKAILGLADTTYANDNSPDTHIEFQKQSRSTFDNWMLQLKCYENIYAQHGLEVAEKQVVTLMYEVDEDTNKFKAAAVQVFENDNYYDYAANAVVPGDYGVWKTDPTSLADAIQRNFDVIDESIQTPMSIAKKEADLDLPKYTDITPTFEQGELFKAKLVHAIESELEEVNKTIFQLESKERNPELVKILKQRKETLENLKTVTMRSNQDAMDRSINFSLALTHVETAIDQFLKQSEQSMNIIREAMSNKNVSISEKNEEIRQMNTIYNKMLSTIDILDSLEEIVAESRNAGNTSFNQNSITVQKLGELRLSAECIFSHFREMNLHIIPEILKTPGEVNIKRISEQEKNALYPELEYKKKQLEKLKNGKALGLLRVAKNTMISLLSKEYKEGLKKRMTLDGSAPESIPLMMEIEGLEREIRILEARLYEGIEYNDQSMVDYINGIIDPHAEQFIGNSGIYNPSALLKGLASSSIVDPSTLIANASSSDLAVSAFTMMYKNAESVARRNFQNDLGGLEFDTMRNNLLQRYSVDQLNSMVSEWRTIPFVRMVNGKPVADTKNVLYFSKPYSTEYENKFREFNNESRKLRTDIYDLRQDLQEAFKTGDTALQDEIKIKLRDRENDRDRFNRQHIGWMLRSCSLPYVNAYYELQQLLPEEIRSELQEKYFELEFLTYDIGSDKAGFVIDETDLDRLNELRIDIRKLREKAKKINPKYAEYMDKFDQLYTFEQDDASFKKAYENARARYANDPKMWEKWLSQNQITRPNDKWYDDVAKIYEELQTLYGAQDPVLKEMMDRRSEIMRPHKDSGKFTSKYMSDIEIEELDNLQTSIDNYLKTSKVSFSSKTTRREIKRLRNQLKALSVKKYGVKYIETYQEQKSKLYNSHRNLVDAQQNYIKAKSSGVKADIDKAQDELIFAEKDFASVELNFERWYNANHKNKYQSITTGFNIDRRSPKDMNFENVPNPSVENEYLETKPHSKYSRPKLKESSMNPNFVKSPEGFPMPKGITKNSEGSYVIDPAIVADINSMDTETAQRKHPNISLKHVEMMKNPEVYEFYNKMMNWNFKLQRNIEGRSTGYMVQGYASSLVQTLSTKGIGGAMSGQFSKFVDKHLSQASGAQDRVENTYGDMGDKLRMRHSEQLPENLQSTDAIGCLVKYGLEAHYNMAMQEVTPMADSFISYLEMLSAQLTKKSPNTTIVENTPGLSKSQQKKRNVDMRARQRNLESVIELMKFERRKFAYGQEETSAKNRRLKRIVNDVFAYTSFIRLGFDLAGQTKNYVSGNLQAFIAASGYDSNHYSRTDWLWAKGKVYGYNGFLHQYFADFGKITEASLDTMLYRYMNPSQKGFEKYLSEVSGSRGRKAAAELLNVQELGYMLQDKGDTEIAVTVMYAVMKRYTFKKIKSRNADGSIAEYEKDAEGNVIEVPAADAYVVNKGALERRTDVDYTQADENRLRNIIYSEMRRTQGNYAKADMTKFEENIMGKLVFFYRKYLVPQFLNRFGYMRPNWESGDMAFGYWRAVYKVWQVYGTANTLKHMVLGDKLASKFGSNVDTFFVIDPDTGELVQKQGDFYRRNISHARRDMIAMAIVTMMSMALYAMLKNNDDDDDEEKAMGFFAGNVMRVMWGVKGETLSMFPLGGGSEEYIRNFTTLTVYTRELKALKSIGSHGLYYLLAMGMDEIPDKDEDPASYELWKKAFYTRKAGFYQKGDAKISKDLFDISGLRNFRNLIDPSVAVQNQKKNE